MKVLLFLIQCANVTSMLYIRVYLQKEGVPSIVHLTLLMADILYFVVLSILFLRYVSYNGNKGFRNSSLFRICYIAAKTSHTYTS